jgi:hypothetical protein
MVVILSLPYVRNDATTIYHRATNMVWQETDAITRKPCETEHHVEETEIH